MRNQYETGGNYLGNGPLMEVYTQVWHMAGEVSVTGM